MHSTKVAAKALASILVWYLRLGHIYRRKLLAIAKNSTIKITGTRELYCITCLLGQLYIVYSRIPLVRPTLLYYLVNVDVVTVRYPSLTKDNYFTLFIEVRALERKVTFLDRKSIAALALKDYYYRHKNKGYTVVVFRLDRGKEYRGNVLLEFAADNSIRL